MPHASVFLSPLHEVAPDNPKDTEGGKLKPQPEDAQRFLELELPYPPSVNHMYKPAGCGFVKSAKSRSYQKACIQKCLGQAMIQGLSRTIDGNVLCEMDIHPPDKRKRDFDNVQKAVWDSVVRAGVIEDDSKIQQAVIRKMEPVSGGKVVVRIKRQ